MRNFGSLCYRVMLAAILVGVLAQPALAKNKGKKFYLTKNEVNAAQAPFACVKGFHMASFFEIKETSVLTYDTVNGLVSDDSGSSVPMQSGWVRTGASAYQDTAYPGFSNCLAYTSSSSTGYGTLVSPWFEINALNSLTASWWASYDTCDGTWPVWCVAD